MSADWVRFPRRAGMLPPCARRWTEDSRSGPAAGTARLGQAAAVRLGSRSGATAGLPRPSAAATHQSGYPLCRRRRVGSCGKSASQAPNQTPRLGIIVCLQSGCVHYSYRFFDETLKDPATASPLLFPETVFSAPASHVASLLGNAPLVYTLLGDPASFLQGLALGAEWLEEKRVDACLVIGAEETNWLRADALWHLDHRAIISGGAGAVCSEPRSRVLRRC